MTQHKYGTALGSLTLLALGMLTFTGCGEGDGYTGDRGTVTGTITYQGTPIPAGVIVTFQAEEGYLASGTTDAEGQYRLVGEQGERIPAVEYQVQLSAPAAAEAAEPLDPSQPAPPPPADPFPAKYGASATSGLSFTVAEGSNTIDIELTD